MIKRMEIHATAREGKSFLRFLRVRMTKSHLLVSIAAGASVSSIKEKESIALRKINIYWEDIKNDSQQRSVDRMIKDLKNISSVFRVVQEKDWE